MTPIHFRRIDGTHVRASGITFVSVCGESGDAPDSFSANHKRVTCPKCRESKAWRDAHAIRWAGEPCRCTEARP